MNARKRQKYFQTVLVLTVSLLMWKPLPASAFAQNGGSGGDAEGGKPGGNISMQAVSGRVVKTMDSGGYTYALVEGSGAKTWVALPKSRIAVGNEITCKPGMVMNNFSSSSLNYTFPEIVFSSGLTAFSAGTATGETGPETDEAPEAPEVPKAKPAEPWPNKF